jgi:hypothetical protein
LAARWTAASGGDQLMAVGQRPATALGGRAHWKLTGERQITLPCTKLDGNKTKPKLRKRETHLGLGKKENSTTRGDRPAGGSSVFLPLATAQRKRVGSLGERCWLKLCSGSAFYRSRRGGEGAPEAVEARSVAGAISVGGSFGGRWFREVNGWGGGAGESVHCVPCSVEERKRRGRGRGAGMAVRCGRPWLEVGDWGGRRWKTAPTGGSRRSASEGGRRGGWAAGLVRWAGKWVGPAGKKIKRKECWLVGWVKEREGGRDRDR